ncbi:uncharacterized protein LOC144447042 [Glandiceps talaboti]
MKSVTKVFLRMGCVFVFLTAGISGEHCKSYYWSDTFYYGFDCPTAHDSSDKTYCCGNTWVKFCCNYNTWLNWGVDDDGDESSTVLDTNENDSKDYNGDGDDDGMGQGIGRTGDKDKADNVGIGAIMMIIFGIIGVIGIIITVAFCLSKSLFFGARTNKTTVQRMNPQLTTISSDVALATPTGQSYLEPPPPYDNYPTKTKDDYV